jgi:ankyrin repeat protein
MHAAIAGEATDAVLRLLADRYPDALLERLGREKEGALHLAVRRKAPLRIVRILVAAPGGGGVRALHERDGRGRVPLHLAFYSAVEVGVIELLVAAWDKALEQPDDDGWLPLHWAVGCDAPLDVVRFVVAAWEPALQVKDGVGRLPLHVALCCRSGIPSVGVVRLLVDLREEALLEGDARGSLPLHTAARERAPARVVEILLDRRGEEALRVKDNEGNLPLHWAVRGGSEELVRLVAGRWEQALLEKDESGMLPLHHAALETTVPVEVVRCVLERCESALRERDDGGRLPLHLAARLRPLEVVRVLTDKWEQALLEKDHHGWLPLNHAFWCESSRRRVPFDRATRREAASIELAQFLVDACPRSLQERTENGYLPLHWAVHWTQPEDVVQIVADGWDQALLERDQDGWLPLHHVISRDEAARSSGYSTSSTNVPDHFRSGPMTGTYLCTGQSNGTSLRRLSASLRTSSRVPSNRRRSPGFFRCTWPPSTVRSSSCSSFSICVLGPCRSGPTPGSSPCTSPHRPAHRWT